MLYKYDPKSKTLEAQPFYDHPGSEKDLENLLADNLGDLYVEAGQLMPIFQERRRQPEPDLCALDAGGGLVIFELKKSAVTESTTMQIMRYCERYGQMGYAELDRIYRNYAGGAQALKDAHRETFQLDVPLDELQFNRKQKLVLVGSSSDADLIRNVEYWRSRGIDIDFLPYRFYQIGGESYFDFFAKPYDYHMNPRDAKGIIFDTNRSYDEDSIWEMFAGSKVSAYGDAAPAVRRFNREDYVLYYHVGWGVVGAGIVKSGKVYEDRDRGEEYRKVDLLTPAVTCEKDLRCVSVPEIRSLLNKNFWWASTVKTPYLSLEEAEKLAEAVKQKYL